MGNITILEDVNIGKEERLLIAILLYPILKCSVFLSNSFIRDRTIFKINERHKKAMIL